MPASQPMVGWGHRSSCYPGLRPTSTSEAKSGGSTQNGGGVVPQKEFWLPLPKGVGMEHQVSHIHLLIILTSHLETKEPKLRDMKQFVQGHIRRKRRMRRMRIYVCSAAKPFLSPLPTRVVLLTRTEP